MLSSSPTTTTHNSLMFELDDEHSNLSTAASPNAHEFLNFSRRITERSLKKPVDAQVGIAYGKDLLFSQRNRPLKNAVKISSPLVHHALNPGSKPAHAHAIHHKPVPHKSIPNQHQKSASHVSALPAPAVPLPQQSPMTTIKSKSNALEELVADVLNYIDSCPDQSAYSYDLAKLKPKLEAISSGKTQS
ncbi:uncharacterized protein ATC70_000697 [Mucor velutinosus]|uniref:Uncharacterized protein n=1 Tax=Mucor velutinosus TaxID=708070 RepID=A0AAN7DI18_9FUNG|nr:hypothetical protein ATC70_000697 [Mucor velutinosus]